MAQVVEHSVLSSIPSTEKFTETNFYVEVQSGAAPCEKQWDTLLTAHSP
jgi:hypothetical protein